MPSRTPCIKRKAQGYSHLDCINYNGPFRLVNAATHRFMWGVHFHSLAMAFKRGDALIEKYPEQQLDYIVINVDSQPIPRSVMMSGSYSATA